MMRKQEKKKRQLRIDLTNFKADDLTSVLAPALRAKAVSMQSLKIRGDASHVKYGTMFRICDLVKDIVRGNNTLKSVAVSFKDWDHDFASQILCLALSPPRRVESVVLNDFDPDVFTAESVIAAINSCESLLNFTIKSSARWGNNRKMLEALCEALGRLPELASVEFDCVELGRDALSVIRNRLVDRNLSLSTLDILGYRVENNYDENPACAEKGAAKSTSFTTLKMHRNRWILTRCPLLSTAERNSYVTLAWGVVLPSSLTHLEFGPQIGKLETQAVNDEDVVSMASAFKQMEMMESLVLSNCTNITDAGARALVSMFADCPSFRRLKAANFPAISGAESIVLAAEEKARLHPEMSIQLDLGKNVNARLQFRAFMVDNPLGRGSNESEFNVARFKVVDEEAVVIARAIAANGYCVPGSLDLSNGAITCAGAVVLAEVLGRPETGCPTRTRKEFTLALDENTGLGAKGVSALCAARMRNPNFFDVRFPGCPFGDGGVAAICDMLRHECRAAFEGRRSASNNISKYGKVCLLRHLFFERSGMSSEGVRAISKLLEGDEAEGNDGEGVNKGMTIRIASFSLDNEKALSSDDIMLLLRSLVERDAGHLTKLSIVRLDELSDAHIHYLGEALPQLRALEGLSLSAGPEQSDKKNNVKISDDAARAFIACLEVSMMRGPRYVAVNLTPRTSMSPDDVKKASRRARFRAVLATAASAPPQFRGGGHRDIVTLICDYWRWKVIRGRSFRY